LRFVEKYVRTMYKNVFTRLICVDMKWYSSFFSSDIFCFGGGSRSSLAKNVCMLTSWVSRCITSTIVCRHTVDACKTQKQPPRPR
jgi:hypothetical protein